MNLTNKKAVLIQLSSLSFLSLLVFYIKGDGHSFFLGLVFSYLYMSLFFYSLQSLFFKRGKSLAIAFLAVKWFLLLGALILVSLFLSPLSFLAGLGIIPALIGSYFLNPLETNKDP